MHLPWSHTQFPNEQGIVSFTRGAEEKGSAFGEEGRGVTEGDGARLPLSAYITVAIGTGDRLPNLAPVHLYGLRRIGQILARVSETTHTRDARLAQVAVRVLTFDPVLSLIRTTFAQTISPDLDANVHFLFHFGLTKM